MTDKDTEQEQGKAEVDRLLHRRKEASGADLAGGGLQFAGAIIVSSLAGSWLDKRFGTGPWLLLLTVFVGAAAGFFGMYRTMNRGNTKDK